MNFKLYLLIFFVVSFVIAPFTLYPDLPWIAFCTNQLYQNNVLNIYSFLWENYNSTLYTFPPLSYYFLGTVSYAQNIFFSVDIPWNWTEYAQSENVFKNNFILKFPLILFLALCGFLIKKQYGLKPAAWFLFNPVSLYAVIVWGHFDIYAVFFTIASVLFFDKNKLLSLVLLGIAASLKSYPILLLPFYFAAQKEKSGFKNILLMLLPLLIYISFIIPFSLNPDYIRAAMNSEQNKVLFSFTLQIGERDFINIFLLAYFALVWACYALKLDILKSVCLFFCAFYAFIPFHPHWIIWGLPFLSVFLIQKKEKKLLFVLSAVYFLYILKWGRHTQFFLLSPIDFTFFTGLPSINKLIEKFVEFNIFFLFVRTFFSFLFLLIIKKILFSKNKNSSDNQGIK